MIAYRPLLLRMRQLDRKCPQQLRDDFLDLDHRDVPSDAFPTAESEIELPKRLHLLELCAGCFKPPLWFE